MVYHCATKLVLDDGIVREASHDTVQAAHKCAILNLAMRDRGYSVEETALLLHPELQDKK